MSGGLGELLNEPDIVVAPGVYDALSAMIAERAGFTTIYLSGASIAYTHLGRPDVGLLGMEEIATVVSTIRERTSLPMIVDADTGFGNALNVQRTVRVLERAGASAIQIEDQAMPKRCGHLDGKTLVPAAEMVGKVRAALDARERPETLVIARTDAIAVEGFEAALERAGAYAAAGADMLFLEAMSDEQQIGRAVTTLGGSAPLMANMVEGGVTPIRPAAELQRLGYSLVIFPGGLVRALARTMADYFAALRAEGTTASFRDRMLDFPALNDLLGTRELLARGKRYDTDSSP